MITKQKAEEIACRDFGSKLGTVMRFVAALDTEQAFPDEATLAEIESVAREILDAREKSGPGPMGGQWFEVCFRLATACRKLGLVKP